MEVDIKKEINKIKKELPNLPDLRDEYFFSLLCYRYFYNDGYLSYSDFYECFVDGKDDGGIDLITTSEDIHNQLSLVLIQSKLISNLSNSQDVVDVFTKIDQTLEGFSKNKTAKYNDRLKSILKEKLSFMEDQISTIELCLFLGTDITQDIRDKIEDKISNISLNSKYQISLFDRNDIENKIKGFLEPKRYVEEAKIKFEKSDGIIEYKDNGILVNLHSNSLKDLYDLYKEDGLFEQNFRYFIRNKKIDSKINESLKDKRDNFWFLNNGIIIGCRDFYVDGNTIKLYKFSIVNGCQTATLIGEYHGKGEETNFVFPCKIVKPLKGKTEEETTYFISEIAESSNSQKPISDRDLKSNNPEQRELKTLLKLNEPKIHLETKRGESIKKKSGTEDWQYTKNDLFGQLVLSFILQRPGTARSGKKKIFSDDNTYNKIFRRTHDKETLVDILKLNYYYKEFLDIQGQKGYSTTDQQSIALNGKFVIIAIIGFLVKWKRRLVNLKKVNKNNEWEKEVQNDNLDGKLFSDYKKDDFEELLHSLFLDIINELELLYKNKEKEEKTVSNFFKSDDKYSNIILKYIISRYEIPMKKKEMDKYMEIF